MSKLEFLNGFFTERLIAAADEIFQVVKDTICEYQEEIDRTKQENRYLRDMLMSISSSGEERRGNYSKANVCLFLALLHKHCR